MQYYLIDSVETLVKDIQQISIKETRPEEVEAKEIIKPKHQKLNEAEDGEIVLKHVFSYSVIR